MNPSYNDSFGSLGSGGAGGNGVGGFGAAGNDMSGASTGVDGFGAGGVGTGMGANGAVGGAGNFGSFSSGGVGEGQGAIVSGPGDAVILPRSGGRKKWPIIVLIVLAMVGLVALVVFAVMPREGGEENREGNTDTDKVLYNIENIDEVKVELAEAYVTGGFDGASKYFDDNIKCADDTELGQICSMVESYFDLYIAEYAVFADAGCIFGEYYSWECAEGYYGEQGLSEKTKPFLRLDEYLSEIQGEEIKNTLKGMDGTNE